VFPHTPNFGVLVCKRKFYVILCKEKLCIFSFFSPSEVAMILRRIVYLTFHEVRQYVNGRRWWDSTIPYFENKFTRFLLERCSVCQVRYSRQGVFECQITKIIAEYKHFRLVEVRILSLCRGQKLAQATRVMLQARRTSRKK
jgi:hypothetical protein